MTFVLNKKVPIFIGTFYYLCNAVLTNIHSVPSLIIKIKDIKTKISI